jgi:predicted Zn-ribbon and HTH transcriptional regulator
MPRVQFKFTSLEVEFEAEVEEVKHLMRIIKKKKQKQVQQWMERVDKSARRIQWNLSRFPSSYLIEWRK